jgi:hypothetical protein
MRDDGNRGMMRMHECSHFRFSPIGAQAASCECHIRKLCDVRQSCDISVGVRVRENHECCLTLLVEMEMLSIAAYQRKAMPNFESALREPTSDYVIVQLHRGDSDS